MNTTPLAQRARAEAARLLPWIERRAAERSTWIGLALVATNAGFPSLAAHLTGLGDVAPAVLASLGAALAAASTSKHPPTAAADPAAPRTSAAPPSATASPNEGATPMSLLKVVRHVLGIVAVAIAPTWNKDIANALAQAEATLVPLLGDDAKKLCEDAASTTISGFAKLANVVSDLAKIAADKGIKADAMVLTVIAAKAYAQVKSDAPALLDVAIETGITVAAGPTVAALTAPVVEAGVAAATGSVVPAAA